METSPQAETFHMYSWWWNSHISPKSSKWLHENLTDMDTKIKAMIRLINEDADSFARRAEMYYKKRPELMNLVEEFYRAYRALAERYDNATGVIRHAHQTMAEAFPNQIPLVLADDSLTDSAFECDQTPDTASPVAAFFDPSHLQNNKCESGSNARFPLGRVRKELVFDRSGVSEEDLRRSNDDSLPALVSCSSEQEVKLEKEIIFLKETLVKLEAEKEAGLTQYQKCVETLSKLESEVFHAQENSKEFSARARNAEAETDRLKEALLKLEAEKETSLLQYQQYLDKMSHLENIVSHAQKDTIELHERATKAETETLSLKQELAIVKSEKDAALAQYSQSLEMIANLENMLKYAEDDTISFRDRSNKAECELETLKHAVAKLMKEKEAAAFQHQRCLVTISNLEDKLACAHGEAQRLSDEMNDGVEKLKGAEERCLLLDREYQSLRSEMESLVQKVDVQSQELTDKKKELGRLWTCTQEERFRFMEAETAFQTLQRLHSQAQEELRYLATELKKRAQSLREMETNNQNLKEELLKDVEEKKRLSELNLSMQSEILSLGETKGKLEEEVVIQVDQRNALQQEMHCLKEKLNELNNEHQHMLKQVEAVGLNPNCLESSVKNLLDENLAVTETFHTEKNEKDGLAKNLETMEQLLEKNALLENSLSALGKELEAVRKKLKYLEESYASLLEVNSKLLDQKTSLITQLQVATQKSDNLSEKNIILETFLSDAHDELEGLKAKSRSLEDSCLVVMNEKNDLGREKASLCSQLDNTEQMLKNLEKTYLELQEKYLILEKDKERALCKVEILRDFLDAEKQKHVNFAQLSGTQLAGMESTVQLLREESWIRERESTKEFDGVLYSQMQIFILQRCARDLEESNRSLMFKYQELLLQSRMSEQLISEQETRNFVQNEEIKSLHDQANAMMAGIRQLLKVLDVVSQPCDADIVLHKTHLDCILVKVKDMKNCVCQANEENMLLAHQILVLITLLQQLRAEVEKLEMEKIYIDNECKETLQLTAVELKTITFERDQLIDVMVAVKNQLCLKGMELVEAKQKLSGAEKEKLILDKALENLKRDCGEIQLIKDNQEVHILKLSRDNDCLKKENDSLGEAKRVLEHELDYLRKENDALRTQEQVFCSELQKERNEAEVWELHAASSFCELQVSIIFQSLLKEKLFEYSKACEFLEDEKNSSCVDVESLRERIGILEGEKEGLKAQMVTYLASFNSLENCISSLEKICFRSQVEISNNEDKKDVESSSHVRDGNLKSKENCMVPDVLSDLQDLQSRFRVIENVMETMMLLKTDIHLSAHSALEVSVKQFQGLKSENNSYGIIDEMAPRIPGTDNVLATKDIMLDHISKCSSYKINEKQVEAENRMLELWETVDQDGNIDLTVSKSKVIIAAPFKDTDHLVEALKKHKYECPSSDVARELAVDKFERSSSKRSVESYKEGSKRKALEKLNSDMQKLTNLQITLKDLSKKFDSIEKRKNGKAIDECNTLKGQLEEADEAILKLFNLNCKLMKNIERSFSTDEKPAMELEESRNFHRKRISQQTRTMSEKIGRLQLEVQRMQFVMLKLDDEKESIKTRIPITRRKVLLRDYLYGGMTRSQKQKKTPFCACV